MPGLSGGTTGFIWLSHPRQISYNLRSDYDFIVRFADPDQPGVAQRYFGLAAELEHILGRPIHLLTDRPIRNPFFAQSVAESRETIYEADQQ